MEEQSAIWRRAVLGPDQVAAGVLERFGDSVDRVSFYTPYSTDQQQWRSILDAFKRA